MTRKAPIAGHIRPARLIPEWRQPEEEVVRIAQSHLDDHLPCCRHDKAECRIAPFRVAEGICPIQPFAPDWLSCEQGWQYQSPMLKRAVRGTGISRGSGGDHRPPPNMSPVCTNSLHLDQPSIHPGFVSRWIAVSRVRRQTAIRKRGRLDMKQACGRYHRGLYSPVCVSSHRFRNPSQTRVRPDLEAGFHASPIEPRNFRPDLALPPATGQPPARTLPWPQTS